MLEHISKHEHRALAATAGNSTGVKNKDMERQKEPKNEKKKKSRTVEENLSRSKSRLRQRLMAEIGNMSRQKPGAERTGGKWDKSKCSNRRLTRRRGQVCDEGKVQMK